MHKGRMVEAWIEHQDPEEENVEEDDAQKKDRNTTASLIKQWVKSRQEGAENDHDMEDFQDDKKSRFSNYSMTSSVMRRSNGLTLLDDRFDKVICHCAIKK
jgi:protein LTV1